ncbi:hypothetical protein ACN9JK_02125 [Enterococcus faecalis]
MSRVMWDEGNEEFASILVSGEADVKSKSNYSKNYILIQHLLNEYATNEPLSFYRFISKKAI